MAKDIEQAKQELLTLYASELADAKALQQTAREARLQGAVAVTQPLFTKSELLASLVDQAETMVLPLRRLTELGAWLNTCFSDAGWQPYGIYLDQVPNEVLRPGDSYLFINTGTARLYGALDRPVSATFAGAWTVDVRQATVQATPDAVIHLRDKVATVNGLGVRDGFASDAKRELRGGSPVGTAAPLNEQERALRDALVDRLRQSGIEVFDNVEVGQRLLDEAADPRVKRGLDTVSLIKDKAYQPSVVTSVDGGRVLQALERVGSRYRQTILDGTGFRVELARALHAVEDPEGCACASFQASNGKVVAIRLADRPVGVTASDRDVTHGISIVVADAGIDMVGAGQAVEYFYPAYELTRADGASLASLIQAIARSLVRGELIDSTGLAERQVLDERMIRHQRVFHGTRADFDAFDFAHMGEGEGAQAYGWGGYVTEVEGIGRTYAQRSPNSLVKSRVESDISRLKEALPFRKGDAKREGEEELKRLEAELAEVNKRQYSTLYTVEIPDDTGRNYLPWETPISRRVLDKVNRYLEAHAMNRIETIYPSRYDGIVTNQDLYEALSAYPRNARQASAILYEIGLVGISYPSNFKAGGTKGRSRNYVLFNEQDLRIIDKVRFFRTSTGQSYGFTVQGKIYIDPRIATTETPIHEYAHLWASAMRQLNRDEWLRIVGLMKRTPLWAEVSRSYPHLRSDDELADEVLARYSGRRGAERLRTELAKSGHASAAIQGVKDILARFWKGVTNLLGVRFTTAEEVADRVLFDLLRGMNPYAQGQRLQPDRDDRVHNGIRHH